jgi:ElaB/YqjD/DUF883 family membrane-anchored ribosome-binding protein
MSTSAEATRKLVTDFRALVTDAEELSRATAAQTGEKIIDLRTRVQQSVAAVKPRLEQAEALVKDTATQADRYVHANPWATAGLAAGIGLIVGLLARRH